MSHTSGLSALEVVELWDHGEFAGDRPQDLWLLRAELLFGAAVAGREISGSVPPSLGERDAWILDLRRRTLGPALSVKIACSKCELVLSAEVDVADIQFAQPTEKFDGARAVEVESSGYTVRAHTPDTDALAVAVGSGSSTVRDCLIHRCVTAATCPQGSSIDAQTLPHDVLLAVGEAIVEADPQSEVRLGLACGACGNEWQPILDIVQFFWAELEAVVLRLEDEIEVLASGYGWSLESILGLSSSRRFRLVQERRRRESAEHERAIDG